MFVGLPYVPHKPPLQAQPTAMEPTRLSRRLRGVTALTLDEAAAAALAEAEAEGRARARAAGARKQLRLEEGRQLAAPFSLWSIGVRGDLGMRSEGEATRLPCPWHAWVVPACQRWCCRGRACKQEHARRRPGPLLAAGVTVWELGRVHRGAWAHRYWSSSGCLYHHAYPVGYRASKVCGLNCWFGAGDGDGVGSRPTPLQWGLAASRPCTASWLPPVRA